MTALSPYLYLRGLRQVDHTVFCVADGQKTYRDPIFNRRVPYSSGQQVKRSILDEMTAELSEARAPVTFNFTLSTKSGKQELGQGEPWSPCNPAFADQLIGGWMRAGKDGAPVKRRSPLSISAMRPLHPTLSGLADEAITFDRSDHPEQHKVRVVNDQGNEVSPEDFLSFLQTENRNQAMRLWIPADKVGSRASGLFIYDVAIDFRTLFSVSLNTFEPELAADTITLLREAGWKESQDKIRLICPEERRKEIIPALSHSLVNWRITSNQARTYSPQNTLAIALSTNANRLGAAIRAELSEESEYRKAEPILDTIDGVSIYTALTAKAYIPGVVATANALDLAEADLAARLLEYDYDA